MKANNIDTNVAKKFLNRNITPSNSAWERLSNKLDEQSKTVKKGWFFYTRWAASIVILISIAFGIFSSNKNKLHPKDEVVISPIDSLFMESKFKNIKIKNELEEAVVEVNETKVKQPKIPKEIIHKPIKNKFNSDQNKLIVTTIDENTKTLSEIKVEKLNTSAASNSTIKVNANDLLFAVTHSQEEVLAYYAKNNIDRKKLIESIEKELENANVKVNASVILAEVEQNINEDTFKNNFLQMIKKKVADVTSAVASRND